MKKITYKKLVKAIPELAEFELDGATDFNRVSAIVGTKNPEQVWTIINCLKAGPKLKRAHAGIAKLFG